MKSITSKEALHNSFELAKSKIPPFLLLNVSFNLNPFPSLRFFSILFFGSAGVFLASPPGSLNFPSGPLHEINRNGSSNKNIKIL